MAQAAESLERELIRDLETLGAEGGPEWERQAHEEATSTLSDHPAKAVDRTRDSRAD
jgi:hypothetical protein